MAPSATKILQREITKVAEYLKDCEGWSAEPLETNILTWKCKITGPKDTPYEDGVFEFRLTFPKDYPFNPPSAVFSQKVFHPNVSENGIICISILKKDHWTPMFSISSIMASIWSFLNDPAVDDPHNADAAKLYMTDKEEYNKIVKDTINQNLSTNVVYS